MDAGRISEAISQWFEREQRPLKFRNTRDPYAIMVSEFMLQQTTVATVLPYYDRFLARFPTLESLAMADEQDVLQMWSGLGYYRRAKQLRAAAVAIAESNHGEFSKQPAELLKLPGFGRYTAGAVASQAFNVAAPILEANTIRVFSRLAGIGGMVGDRPFMDSLWQVADHLVNAAESPRLLNMGAMELGAIVCRATPLCDICPVNQHCRAFASGNPSSIPVARPRREKVHVKAAGFAIENSQGNWLIRQIPAGQWHAGMWEFPTFAIDVVDNLTASHAGQLIKKQLGLTVEEISPVMEIKSTVTHHAILTYVFHCTTRMHSSDLGLPKGKCYFASLDEISRLPMGSAQKKVLKRLEELNRKFADEPR